LHSNHPNALEPAILTFRPNTLSVGAAIEAVVQYTLQEKNNENVRMMVVATDAPLDARNLARLAKRAFMGLARTGGIASNGSGDYVIAFSTDDSSHIPHQPSAPVLWRRDLDNDAVTPLFMAAIEATEEAIVNSLLAAKPTKGRDGHVIESIPMDKLIPILKKYNRID
jgi:D-aminopeptidase